MTHQDAIVSIYCPHCRQLVVKERERSVRLVSCPRCHSLFSVATALKTLQPTPEPH
ncbi:MAG: hypothetical protein JWL62_1640 [Hyphomicrobiales bacterium]|nr:hypothetical protein [Hyphomicrobiales bacterium]